MTKIDEYMNEIIEKFKLLSNYINYLSKNDYQLSISFLQKFESKLMRIQIILCNKIKP